MISAATVERLLVPVHTKASMRGKWKTAPKPSQVIRVRTLEHWDEPPPGFLEIDFVAHGGGSMRGDISVELGGKGCVLGPDRSGLFAGAAEL